jgi:chromosome segregation ATPase
MSNPNTAAYKREMEAINRLEDLSRAYNELTERKNQAETRLANAQFRLREAERKREQAAKVVEAYADDPAGYSSQIRAARATVEALDSDIPEARALVESMTRLAEDAKARYEVFPHKRLQQLKKKDSDIRALRVG